MLSQVREPVIIHWLGDMFDPALAGYWGTSDLDAAMETAVDIIDANAAKVDGIKISLLDKDKEIAMRRRLPTGRADVHRRRLQLRRADRRRRAAAIRDALLGIFDAIAPAASAALAALAARRPRELPRHPGADRAAVAPHLPGADPLLQDGRRVHGLAQRPSGPFHHGRRPAERALDSCISPSCSGWPTRPACSRDPELAAQRMKAVLADRGIAT